MKEKKLLVKTPITTNGNTLAYDANKQPLYKKTILELGAKRELELENVALAEHLRHEFEEIEVDANGEPKPKANGEPKPKALENYNKAELGDKAKELGIEVPDGATNKIIIELIKEAEASK